MSGELLTIPEAAALLGVSRRVAYREAKERDSFAGLPLIDICGRKRISKRQLNHLLDTGKVA